MDPATIPALSPPGDAKSDFTTKFLDLQPVFIAVTAICIAIATFVVAGRLFVKVKETKGRPQVLEYFVMLAWLGYTSWAAFVIATTVNGMGRHQWNVTALQMLDLGKLADFLEIHYCAVIVPAKIALLLEYVRIFCAARRGPIYVAIHVLIWSNLLVYLFVFFWLIFACNPREKAWNPSLPGTCFNPKANSVFSSSWNLVSDFSILALPLYSIWHLQMPVKKKLGVSAVFAVGFLGCLASIGRMAFGVVLLTADDVNYVIAQNGLFSMVELFTIITCGSLPMMPKFFHQLSGKKTTPTYASYGYENRYASRAGRDGPALIPRPGINATNRSYIPLDEVDSGIGPRVNISATAGVYPSDWDRKTRASSDEDYHPGAAAVIVKNVDLEQVYTRG